MLFLLQDSYTRCTKVVTCMYADVYFSRSTAPPIHTCVTVVELLSNTVFIPVFILHLAVLMPRKLSLLSVLIKMT